jgi:hypothetical protein
VSQVRAYNEIHWETETEERRPGEKTAADSKKAAK